MSERLAAIHLYGPLAEQFGAEHRFAVSTPIEAVRALDANHPGFIAAFAGYERYALYADGDWRDGDEAAQMPFSRELHIAPMIEGRAFLGTLLVGALFPALTTTTILGVSAATLIGGALFAGLMIGLSFLLAPKVTKPKDAARDENYAFTGPENVTGQGAAVPLIYGRIHAGTVVVSAGLDLNTDLAVTVPAEAIEASPSTAVTPPDLAPPPGGWPAIVYDKLGRPGPAGWRLIGTTYATVSDEVEEGTDYVKQVDLWQPSNAPTYYWNRARGYYSSALHATQPGDPDWQPLPG